MMENLPQIIYLALVFLGLGTALANPAKQNIWATLFSTALVLGLLFWGGFFNGLLGLQ